MIKKIRKRNKGFALIELIIIIVIVAILAAIFIPHIIKIKKSLQERQEKIEVTTDTVKPRSTPEIENKGFKEI